MRQESGCTLSLFFSDVPYVDTECIVSAGFDDGDMLPNGMAVLPLLSACNKKSSKNGQLKSISGARAF